MSSNLATCIQVSMKTCELLLRALSPEIPLCIRGVHGIGKSTVVHDAAKDMRDDFYKDPENAAKFNWTYEQGLPVVERRLSQLTEGDLTGMPSLDADRRTTVFKPCDWLIDACDRPVVLFLDERNRALEGVKQAVFQIMDSRAFYGHKLHPGTRVVVAENVGDLYTVQQYDPAEVSRAATVELVPEVSELLDYMRRINCDERTIAFLNSHRQHVEYNPNVVEKGRAAYDSKKKYPDRRAWVRLDKECRKLNLLNHPESPLFYPFVASMVGIEAATAFVKFVKEYKFEVTAEEILKDWDAAKLKLGKTAEEISATKYLELIEMVIAFAAKNKLQKSQGEQIRKFALDLPHEHRMNFFSKLQKCPMNLVMVTNFIGDIIMKTVTAGSSN